MGAISIDYGTVQVFDDAAPADIYRAIVEAGGRIPYHWGWRAEHPHARYWHHDLLAGDIANPEEQARVLRAHPVPAFGQYIDWLRSAVVPPESRLLRYYLNAHTFGTDGSPHTDSSREDELTLVHFVASEWRAEFGGETVVFDAAGEIERAVLPRPNRLVTFAANRLHAPRPLSKLFPGLRVVLVTKFRAAEGRGFARAG